MDPQDMLKVMDHALALKQTPRAGWPVMGISPAESVADHSYATALLARMLAREEGLDEDKAAVMALAHDLAEAVTGDIITASGRGVDEEAKRRKHAREKEIFADILAHDESFKAVALEYMAQSSPLSRVVKDADLLELAMQALQYERQGRAKEGALEEFWEGARHRVSTRAGKALLEALERSRS